MSRGRDIALLCLSLLLALEGAARAEEGPYSNFMVGERALGLGGAAVAVADDPGAVFHNPGGIASLTTSAASGSLWAMLRGGRLIDDGYRTELGATNLDHSAGLSFPAFLAGVVKLGEKQSDGVRPHALGAAIISPHSDEYRFIAQLQDTGAVDRLEVRHGDKSRWYGIAYGLRLRPGLSLGVTTFLAQRSLSHDEVEINAREDLPAGSAVGSSISRASTLDISVYHLIARLGVHLDLAPQLRAGVMFQPPGFELSGSASAERLDTTVGPDPTTIVVNSTENLDANLPVPWELRLGLTWLDRPSTLVTLDVSIFGPAGSPSDPLPLVAGDSDGALGAFVPRETYRRTALRGAIGFESELDPMVPIRGGLFFERSSAPEVLSTSDIYLRDHIDTFGGAFSLGLRTGGYDLSFGVTGLLGTGESLALVRSDDPDVPRYAASDVTNTVLMVFVGGAKSAVKRLVKTLSN